jgi:glutathione S-transferase
VPVLIHPDGTVITEGPAILSHLADAFPVARLAPAPGTSARATQDRWIAFFQANVYEAMLRELAPGRYTDDLAAGPAIASAATAYVRRHFLIFEAEVALGHTPGPAGNTLSALDIYVWMLCFWLDRDWLAKHCPTITGSWEQHRRHPVLAPVEAAHFG